MKVKIEGSHLYFVDGKQVDYGNWKGEFDRKRGKGSVVTKRKKKGKKEVVKKHKLTKKNWKKIFNIQFSNGTTKKSTTLKKIKKDIDSIR
tara:strand:- start:1056 stop:1325 length:270 start_codon:yes stop_codon:yes gene_type:complete